MSAKKRKVESVVTTRSMTRRRLEQLPLFRMFMRFDSAVFRFGVSAFLDIKSHALMSVVSRSFNRLLVESVRSRKLTELCPCGGVLISEHCLPTWDDYYDSDDDDDEPTEPIECSIERHTRCVECRQCQTNCSVCRTHEGRFQDASLLY